MPELTHVAYASRFGVGSAVSTGGHTLAWFKRDRLRQLETAALKARGGSYARSHGNYLPALDKALEILQDDAHNRGTLMLLFLSDGAPSDHVSRSCPHGFPVWTAAPGNLKQENKK